MATVQDLIKDVDSIAAQAKALDDSLGKGETLGYVDGVKIGVAGASLTWLLNSSAARAKTVPTPTEAEGAIAVDKLERGVVPPCVSALQKLSALRPHADTLVIGGLAKIIVQRLGDAAALYSQTGVDIAPTDALKAKGKQLKATVDGAFARTIQVYSTATGGEETATSVEQQAGNVVQTGQNVLGSILGF